MQEIYLTSTFTNPWNVSFNPRIGEALAKAGLSCHLPQKATQHDARATIFSNDIKGINASRCILAVALNESPNWGAEVGYAYGLKKPVIALTDQAHQLPLICEGMITETFKAKNLDDIDSYINDLAAVLKKHTSKIN